MGSVKSGNRREDKIKKSCDLDIELSVGNKQTPGSKHPLLDNDERVSSEISTRAQSSNSRYIRAVSKNGDCNIFPANVQKRKFLRDIFTTLVDTKWRYTLTIFTLGFIISWTFFAVLWWLIAIFHDDLEPNHLPMHQAASNWTPCVTDIYGFTSCFLFSVETQQTTGYGEKRPTEKCSDAVVLMCIQSAVGLIVDAFLVGIFFAKLTRPKLRTQTIQFSKFAVITMRENTLCLIFRLGDMRKKSRIIEAKVKALLIQQKVSKDGETVSNHLTKLPITIDDCDADLLFIWPMNIVHKIDSSSPLYKISKKALSQQHFEIIVSLEGTIESTDQKTQARSSYLADEILWGRRFALLMSVSKIKRGYKVDYSKFDKTTLDDTPECSAEEQDLKLKLVV